MDNLNGHNPYWILRGEKGSLNEGGLRVPFIFSWPQMLKKGFKQEQPFCYLDMLATFPHLLNLSTKNLCMNDSKNASELFFYPLAEKYRPYLILQDNGRCIAVRSGKWKWIPAQRNQNQELYNLENDPSELHNVQFDYWPIVLEFKERIEEIK